MIKYSKWMLFVFAVIFIGGCGKSETPTVTTKSLKPIEDCKGLPDLQSRTPQLTCYSIELPANYEDAKDTRQVNLFVTYLKAKKPSNKAPIVQLIGGPGGGATSIVRMLSSGSSLEFLANDRDVLFVDYRGTGLSEPYLDPAICADVKETSSGNNAIGFAGPALVECYVKRFHAKKMYPSDYTTRNIARDITEVLNAFEIKKVVLHGTSYGTNVALTIARDYPERVSKMILEGIFPPQVNGYMEQAEAYLYGLNELDKKYTAVYKTSLKQEINALAKRMVSVEDKDRLRAFGHKYAGRAFESDVLPEVHEALQLMKNAKASTRDFGRTQSQEALINRMYGFSQPMFYFVTLQEEARFHEEAKIDLFGFDGQVYALFESNGNTVEASRAFWRTLMKKLQPYLAPKNPIDHKIVTASIPTAMFSGGKDLQTPINWALQTQKYLSNVRHFFYPMSGHITSWREEFDSARELIRVFLDKDLKALDSVKADDFKQI